MMCNAQLVIGHITALARPSVRPSVRLSAPMSRTGAQLENNKA